MIDSPLDVVLQQRPRVSVLLPAYNARRFLREAVDSILNQTYEDFELLITDDGSTDDTPQILDDYARRDSRVRVFRQSQSGIVAALNRMLEESKGELIARMDADDIAAPTRFEAQVAYLDQHPECVALGTAVEVIDQHGLVVREEQHHSVYYSSEGISERIIAGKSGALRHPTIMARKAAVVQVGGYREEYRLVEDLDLYLRLDEIGDLMNLPEKHLKYRVHLQSENHTKWRQQAVLLRKCVLDAYARRNCVMNGDDIPFPSYSFPPRWRTLCNWGWGVLHSGARWRAAEYAIKSILAGGFRQEPLKLLLCAVRGQ